MANPNRVFITRPAHQNAEWQARLAEQGWEAVAIPLLGIEPVNDKEKKQLIIDQVTALDQQQIIIFVSQNAVQIGFDWIEQYWPQFPIGLTILCIGNKTERFLQSTFMNIYGYSPLTNCVSDRSEMTSEALLHFPGLNDVSTKKITIFRGVGGRTALKETLEAKGAQVTHCELYWRTLPSAAIAEFKAAKLDPAHDVVSVFSGETLQNFHHVLHELKIARWQEVRLLVPSHRVTMMAHELGFRRVQNALNASEEHMWQGLTRLLSFSSGL